MHMESLGSSGSKNEVANYHKYVDNLLLHNPDPKSTDFMT
jgi:hypothetical protein